ncbi:hypothetical protein FQA39_LY12081 [Lamprigera yunnana]|nr:hypothetical protein FQA39_LY12081 [Lamprigera yunnana]
MLDAEKKTEQPRKKCGLFPWNPAEVRVEPKHAGQPKALRTEEKHFYVIFWIGKEKLAYFLKNEGEWAGATEEKSLFDLWTLWKTKMAQEISKNLHRENKKSNSTNLLVQSATIESHTIDPSGIQNLAHDMNVCTQLTICFPDDQQSAPGSAIILSRNDRSSGNDIDEAVLMIDQPSTSSLIPRNNSSSSSHSQSDFSLQESGDSELGLAISDDGNEGEEVSLDELKEGTFILAKFKEGKRNLTVFVYLCVIQELREDGNIVVMGLKNTDSEKKEYVAEEKDVCEINLKEIVRLVEEPELIVKGERVSYRFKKSLNVS